MHRNGYHGCSPFTMDVTNLGTWKYQLPRTLGSHAVRRVGHYLLLCTVIIVIINSFRVLTLMCIVAHGEELGVEMELLKHRGHVIVLMVNVKLQRCMQINLMT